MNDKDFQNNRPRSTFTDDHPMYRFQEYENVPESQVPAAYQQNQRAAESYNAFPSANLTDEKHLDQLSLGFKIYAGLNALFSSFPIIHLVLGILIVTGRMDGGKDAPPPEFGWFFIIFALVFILLGYTMSVCNFYAGKFMKERRNYTFCFVISCINCLSMPLGTVLGALSIIVLVRDSVKNLFQEKAKENQFN